MIDSRSQVNSGLDASRFRMVEFESAFASRGDLRAGAVVHSGQTVRLIHAESKEAVVTARAKKGDDDYFVLKQRKAAQARVERFSNAPDNI